MRNIDKSPVIFLNFLSGTFTLFPVINDAIKAKSTYFKKDEYYIIDLSKIKKLEGALLYYADFENQTGEYGEYGNLVCRGGDTDEWELDKGKIAQKALEEK